MAGHDHMKTLVHGSPSDSIATKHGGSVRKLTHTKHPSGHKKHDGGGLKHGPHGKKM
jgi:hypothetical protein